MNKFGPKTNDHPSIGEKCPVCDILFNEGDYTTLAVIGATGEDREKMLMSKSYNAIAMEIHWDCRVVGGNENG